MTSGPADPRRASLAAGTLPGLHLSSQSSMGEPPLLPPPICFNRTLPPGAVNNLTCRTLQPQGTSAYWAPIPLSPASPADPALGCAPPAAGPSFVVLGTYETTTPTRQSPGEPTCPAAPPAVVGGLWAAFAAVLPAAHAATRRVRPVPKWAYSPHVLVLLWTGHRHATPLRLACIRVRDGGGRAVRGAVGRVAVAQRLRRRGGGAGPGGGVLHAAPRPAAGRGPPAEL